MKKYAGAFILSTIAALLGLSIITSCKAQTTVTAASGGIMGSAQWIALNNGTYYNAATGQVVGGLVANVGVSAGSNVGYNCDPGGHCYTFNTLPVAARKRNPHPPTIQMVKDSGQPLAEAVLAPADYVSLADSIGLSPSTSSDEARITAAIAKLGLHVYTFKLVDQYLYDKAVEHGKSDRWVWKPMRKRDVEAFSKCECAQDSEAVDDTGVLDNVQYAREIPISVLANVKNVLAEVPNASFLISDYTNVKPDPFLAVTTPRLLVDGKIWVIQVWDEPGFHDSSSSTMLPRHE